MTAPQPEPQAFIKRLQIVDLPELNFTGSEIVVFVGPNNGGKTYCLDAIYNYIAGSAPQPETNITVGIQGTGEKAWERLASTPGARFDPKENQLHGPGWSVTKKILEETWQGSALQLTRHGNRSFLQQFFIRVPLEARARFDNSRIVESPAEHVAPVDHNNPIAMMARQPKLCEKVSKAFKDAFGTGIFLNTGVNGPNYQILLGEKPDLGGLEPVADASQEKFSSYLPLSSQGSGMQAFAKIIVATLSRDAFVTFIDEPETFLHPPQAYALGKFIAENRPTGRQLFLATHSVEFLKGLLEGASDRVRIIRVSRSNATSHATTIETSELHELWSDLFLQFSNVLAGLFHDTVIGCEAEQDCRYFSGIHSAMAQKSLIPKPRDTQYVTCGGKGVLRKVLTPLRAFGVNSVIVVDFDIIENEGELRKLAEAAGCSWETIQSDAKIVREHFNKLGNHVTTAEAYKAIDEFEQRTKDTEFVSQSAVEELRKVIRVGNGWTLAKEKGIYVLPTPTREAADRLLVSLKKRGVFVISQGTLESLNPEEPGKGAERIEKLLKMDVSAAPQFENTRAFVRELTQFSLS